MRLHSRKMLGQSAASVASAAVCLVVPAIWWHYQLAAASVGEGINFLNYDWYHYTVPAFRYAAAQLRHGRLPLWTPEQLCGGPFLAAQLHGILYPLHWLIVVLSLATVWKVLIVAHEIVAMAGGFVCARAFGAGRAAALLAGVTYAFSGSVISTSIFSMEPVPVSVAWLPWQLACTRAALRDDCQWFPAAVGLGVISALCLVGGHLSFLPVPVVICGLYAAMHVGLIGWRRGWWLALRRGARLLLGAGVAAGLAAIQMFPTLELVGRSVRVGAFRSAQEASVFAFSPTQLLTRLVDPLPGAVGVTDQIGGGIATIGLMLVPFIESRYRRRAVAVWLLGAVVTLLAMGTRTPLFGWLFHLQGASIRDPERFIAGTALCLALLAGLGADALYRARRPLPILCALVLMAVVPLLLVATVPADLATQRRLSLALAVTRSRVLWLVGIGSVCLLPWNWCRTRLRPAVLLAAIGLVAYELYGSTELKVPIPATRPDALKIPTRAAAFVRSRAGLARVVTPLQTSAALQGNEIPVRLGMLENLQAISDYEPLVDRRFAELMWSLSSARTGAWNAHLGPYMDEVAETKLPLLRFLGVGFIMVPHNGAVRVPLPRIYSDAEADVYALADPLPRAYVAKDVRAASTSEQARSLVLGDTSWILRRGAVVEDPDFQVKGGEGSVSILRYEAEEVVLEADLSRPGLVVLQDEYDPYWRAQIDGINAPILRVNYAFRGVAVGAGTHTIRFAYHPSLVYAGAAVSMLTILALAGGAMVRLRGAWRVGFVR